MLLNPKSDSLTQKETSWRPTQQIRMLPDKYLQFIKSTLISGLSSTKTVLSSSGQSSITIDLIFLNDIERFIILILVEPKSYDFSSISQLLLQNRDKQYAFGNKFVCRLVSAKNQSTLVIWRWIMLVSDHELQFCRICPLPRLSGF